MNNILKDLWYGDVSPCERCGVGDTKLNQLIRDIEQMRVALCGTLTPQQAEQLYRLRLRGKGGVAVQRRCFYDSRRRRKRKRARHSCQCDFGFR